MTKHHPAKDKSHKLRPSHTANNHPPKVSPEPTKPNDRHGFRTDCGPGAMALKNWIRRDDPDRDRS
jgi:hypothetical protein